MRKSVLLLVGFSLPCLDLRAQEDMAMPSPPKELQKFERLIGTWTGKGMAVMAPGAPEMPWTSKSMIRKVLNGFFLQEDTVIEAGPNMTLVFRTFYGFDTQNKKYMQCMAGNMGGVAASEIHWVDDDTMVSAQAAVSPQTGRFTVERWVTKIAKDQISFFGQQAIGDGEPFVHLKGTMERTDGFMVLKPLEAAPGLAQPGEAMERLGKMAGRYTFKGSYQHVPGAEPMQITGEETLVPIFGGTVLECTTKGQPMDYEMWSAFSWNPVKKCYTQICVSNMGEIGQFDSYKVDGRLVSAHSGQHMGQPAVLRGIVILDEDGTIRSAYAHAIQGTQEPMKVFETTYTRKN